MSITNRLITHVAHQRYLCSGKILTNALTFSRGRALHSIAPVRFKVLGNDICGSGNKGNKYGFVNSFGRNAASVFIISRNESTTTSDLLGTAVPGTGDAQPLSKDSIHEVLTTVSGTNQSENLSSSQSSNVNVEAVSPPAAEPISSSVPTQESLVFESIPEPPVIPTGLEEVSLNALGEPSLASMGLGGWSPSGMIQQCLEFFHATLGMPWWVSIITGTIIVRLLMFPLVIKSQRNAAKMQNYMPELQVLQAKMTEARQTGNALLSAKYGQEMMIFMKEKDISPFKSMLVPLAMAPVFISFFFGLRKMANLPVESMKEGGLFWFTDLTIADPYYLLPLVTSVTMYITLELGADGMKLNSAQHGQLLKYFMRALPVIMFPFTLNFPAAILCYWVSTNAISLVQVSFLKIPSVRTALKIEPLRKFSPEVLQMTKNKKGFRESLKESWTNMRITRELEDRQNYDEISFKRAGKGPIPKTYKYDPTKVSKDTIVAAQAKRK